jgi:hypothetical protein
MILEQKKHSAFDKDQSAFIPLDAQLSLQLHPHSTGG